MCGKKIGNILAQVGLPLVGGVAGDLLGPSVGLSEGLGGGIGGALGGLGAGFLTGADPLGIALNAGLGGLGGYALGSALGPGAGFGEGGAFAGPAAPGIAGAPAHGAGGVPAGMSAAAAAAPAASADVAGEGGILDFIQRNQEWLLPAVVGGGAALLGNDDMPGEGQLKALAAQAKETAKLQEALLSGQLPPGAQGLVQNAMNDRIAGIRSNYASMGLSGSTMEAQDIARAQSDAASQTFEIANALAAQGLNAAGLSADIYRSIAQYALLEDASFTDALAALSEQGGYYGGLTSVA